jgi:hypothetical protein
MSVNLQPSERELVELTLEDLRHIAKETEPECDDHQLRRVSVQLRRLLVENTFIQSWKLLQLQPKSPVVVAPRLRAEGLGQHDFAVAGGGTIGGLAIANARFMPGRTLSAEAAKAIYEREKNDMAYSFSLSEYKDSCAVYVTDLKISRRQLVQYVANKKGGAHLDHKRKKDEEAYSALDVALAGPVVFGGGPNLPGKNAVYLELLSIGQFLTNSPDTKRFLEAASAAK